MPTAKPVGDGRLPRRRIWRYGRDFRGFPGAFDLSQNLAPPRAKGRARAAESLLCLTARVTRATASPMIPLPAVSGISLMCTSPR